MKKEKTPIFSPYSQVEIMGQIHVFYYELFLLLPWVLVSLSCCINWWQNDQSLIVGFMAVWPGGGIACARQCQPLSEPDSANHSLCQTVSTTLCARQCQPLSVPDSADCCENNRASLSKVVDQRIWHQLREESLKKTDKFRIVSQSWEPPPPLLWDCQKQNFVLVSKST